MRVAVAAWQGLQGPDSGGADTWAGFAATCYRAASAQLSALERVAEAVSGVATSSGPSATERSFPTAFWWAISIAAGLWVAGYVLGCAFWPWARCKGCKGTGKRPSPSGKAFRDHSWCEGTGRRLRIGRRLYNYFSS